MNPAVTIIVPHWNIPPGYLNRCLASIRAQTFRESTEIILIDNHSDVPPSAPEGVTYVLHGENRGIPYSLNEGYQMSCAEFCCMVGADDWIEPNWIEDAVQKMISHRLAFVSPETEEGLCYPEIKERNPMHMGSLFKRNVVLKLGGYRAVPFFDWDLFVRIAKAGYSGVGLGKHYYNWDRERPGGDHFLSEPRYDEYKTSLQALWESEGM